MLVKKAHKIRLDPSNSQKTYFMKASGVARWSYNWALSNWQTQYESHRVCPSLPKPNSNSLKKQFNQLKRSDPEFNWILEVTKCASEQAIRDVDKAFSIFLRGKSNYPQFKKKNKSKDSFYLSNDQIKVSGKAFRVPKLGWVRMTEELRWPNTKIVSCIISRTADHWYASFNCIVEIEPKVNDKPTIGVDLGVSSLATFSDGTKVSNGRITKKHAKKLRRLGKELSRRKKGSKNRAKTAKKLARHHATIAFERANQTNQLTNYLVNNYSFIGIEDLNVKGMVKNSKLSKAIYDTSFGEIVRQLQYKAVERGAVVVKVDRFFASSKLCSDCGIKNQDMTLSTRNWVCTACGALHDRDINAAINIKNEAIRINNVAVGSTVLACGVESSGTSSNVNVKLFTEKQEPNSVVLNYV